MKMMKAKLHIGAFNDLDFETVPQWKSVKVIVINLNLRLITADNIKSTNLLIIEFRLKISG